MSSRSFNKSLEIEETRLSMPHDDDNDQSTPRTPPVQAQSSRSDDSCLELIGVCLLLVIPLIAVAILIILIYITALPVLILSFLVTRALQIVWHGDDYNRAVQLKLFIRSIMFLVSSLLAIVLAISYGIAKLIPGFKRAVILETPLEDWIKLVFLIYGIYMLHWVLSVCVFKCVPNIPLDIYQSGFNAPENVLEIIDCLILLLAVSQVENRVPVFKADKIHGLCTRKWVEVTILVFLAYNVIVLLTRLIIANGKVLVTKFLKLFGINSKMQPAPETTDAKRSQNNIEKIMHIMHIRYVKYCAVGMKQSIDFILSSIVFLLTWEIYFRSHLEETPQAERVLQVGTMSCVTLLVCAILWFIKTKLLLIWEVRAVYNRLEHKIVKGAKQLYFLGILSSRKHDIFKIQNVEADGQEGGYIRVCLNLFPAVWDNQKRLAAKWNTVCGNLVIKEDTSEPSFYGLHQMAYYFLKARETLKDDKYTHRVIKDLKEWINDSKKKNSDNNEVISVTKEELMKLTEDLLPKKQQQQQQQQQEQPQQQQQPQKHCQQQEHHPHHHHQQQPASNMDGKTKEKKEGDKIDNWKYFHEQMLEYVDPPAEGTEEYKLEQIEKWMESARNNCLFLANTLSSAKELVGCLNNIISLIVIAATFILWLLLTGFATTRVLVLFGSPLLAASFIFGDTCKTLFQGFIFVYVVHPFHVGDFCIIDQLMLEVRTIGIWITTFSKVDTREEVIYPNSTLFTKTITNHRTNFDWNDNIKLEVGPLNMGAKDLKDYIEESFEKSTSFIVSLVVVTRSENVTKIAVNYKSKDMKNSTYSQCLKEKQKQKSNFLHDLQDKVELINFDWNDHVELEIGSVNIIKRKKLKESVQEYFKKNEIFTDSSVVVSTSENVTKIAVTYTYKCIMDKEKNTYSQCLKEKQMMKSKLLDDLQEIVEQKNNNELETVNQQISVRA